MRKELYRAIAYVTVPASENWRWIGEDKDEVVSHIDTKYLTHINFAFGMIETYQFEENTDGRPITEGEIVSKEAYKNPSDNEYHYRVSLVGWLEEIKKMVDGRKYLRALVKLKEKNPNLKILLSIGGWDSDGFCYMAQTKAGRKEFIDSCIALMDEYQIDGIDLDWEYPMNGGWGTIAHCSNCIQDACSLLKEMRIAFDLEYGEEHKLLSIASAKPWVDEATFQFLNFVNIMCYDSNSGSGKCQAPFQLLRSLANEHIKMVGSSLTNKKKLNIGLPFYNEAGPYLVPYHKKWSGYIDCSPMIIKKKMLWTKWKRYGGAFYWAYSMDKFEQDVENSNSKEIKILQRTLFETLNGRI